MHVRRVKTHEYPVIYGALERRERKREIVDRRSQSTVINSCKLTSKSRGKGRSSMQSSRYNNKVRALVLLAMTFSLTIPHWRSEKEPLTDSLDSTNKSSLRLMYVQCCVCVCVCVCVYELYITCYAIETTCASYNYY